MLAILDSLEKRIMKITYNQIMSFKPCYDPTKIGMTRDYEANISDFIVEFRNKVKRIDDINWTLLRQEFIPKKDLRLFTVWCVRPVQHLMTDQRSINALNVAEKYAYEQATEEELMIARDAAYAAYAAYTAADYTAYAAAAVAAYAAYTAADYTAYAYAAAYAATFAHYAHYDARNKQIDKLLDYFKTIEAGREYDWGKI